MIYMCLTCHLSKGVLFENNIYTLLSSCLFLQISTPFNHKPEIHNLLVLLQWNLKLLKIRWQMQNAKISQIEFKGLEIVQVTAVVNLEGGKIITVQKAKKDSEKSTKVFFILKVMLLINHLLLLMMRVMQYERYAESIEVPCEMLSIIASMMFMVFHNFLQFIFP